VHAVTGAEQSVKWFEASHDAAKTQGERIFTELLGNTAPRLKEERERAKYAFDARRSGHRPNRLACRARAPAQAAATAEHDARMAALDDAEASVPDLERRDDASGGAGMSPWIDRILKEFPADLSRLWIATDPDDVLLDEQVLSGLRERGFEVMPFEDSVAFRAEYEDRYRECLGPW
jgi:hypothetical protein